MPVSTLVIPPMVGASSLFKDWVKITSKNGQPLSSTFEDYQLIEQEEGEWLEVDNTADRKAREDQHAYLRQYAAGEYLAHRLAYQNQKILADNPVQLLLEEDGSIAEYYCERLQKTSAGLVGYVLIPMQVEQGKKPDIKIFFRGTKSKASMFRDLEPGGAGVISFVKDRDLILGQVNEIVRGYPQGVTLTIAGHSLGGADAQNCTAALIDAISQNQGITYSTIPTIPFDSRDHLRNVERLRLFTYNAAGVPQAIANRSAELLSILAEKRAKGESIPRLEAYNQRVGGDGVQQTGEAHLLSNVPSQHAKVDVLKAHIGSEQHHRLGVPEIAIGTAALTAAGGLSGLGLATALTVCSAGLGVRNTKTSHCSHLFNAPRAAQYESFSNSTPEGQAQVHAELSHKSAWLNTFHKGSLAFYNRFKSLGKDATTTNRGSNVQQQEPVTPISVTEAGNSQSRPWYRAFF